MKRQQITTGAIIRIDLGNGYFNYAQILDKGKGITFFDIYTKEAELKDISLLQDRKVLFIIAVYNDIITKGRWLKVGKLPVRDDLTILPMKFIQDIINPKLFRLYNPNTGEMFPATRDECEGLEVAAVWEAWEVEQRIKDYYEEGKVWKEKIIES